MPVVLDFALSAPVTQQVIDDDVLSAFVQELGDLARKRRTKAPWRRELGIEETAPSSFTELRTSERASISLRFGLLAKFFGLPGK
jgi:hypothetical protein